MKISVASCIHGLTCWSPGDAIATNSPAVSIVDIMSEWSEGIALVERLLQAFKRAKHYSVPYSREGVKVKVEVMQRVKGRRADLFREEQVTEVRARVMPASVTLARLVGRTVVLGVARVLDVQRPPAGEQLAVAR